MNSAGPRTPRGYPLMLPDPILDPSLELRAGRLRVIGEQTPFTVLADHLPPAPG
jgi:hypothetical protein